MLTQADTNLTAWLAAGAANAMLWLDRLAVVAVVMIVMDLTMRIFDRVRVIRRDFRHVRAPSSVLRGRLLFLFGPTGLNGQATEGAPLGAGQIFHAAFTANLAAFPPHRGHDLRDCGAAEGQRRFSLRGPIEGFVYNAPGILNRIEAGIGAFGPLTTSLWHNPQSHGRQRFVKLNSAGMILNRPTTHE